MLKIAPIRKKATIKHYLFIKVNSFSQKTRDYVLSVIHWSTAANAVGIAAGSVPPP
jgi:hypothetical protein